MDVTIRAYDPRDAANVVDIFFRSVRQVALSAYTAVQVRAWAPEPRTAEWAHGEANDGRLVAITTRDDGTARVRDLATTGCQATSLLPGALKCVAIAANDNVVLGMEH